MDAPDLLVTLSFAVATAAVGALVAVRLGQSAMLGYILGGVMIGPYTPGLVADLEAVGALADIGVVFLLFAVGVQISLRDLIRSGPVALVGGSAQVLATIAIGYAAGVLLGWRPIEALFFGAVLSNSSSTVLSKVLGERGEAGAEHGQVALAWSTIQDLSTIVLVVVLGALARGSESIVGDLLWSTIWAIGFLVLLVPIGLRVLPRAFEWLADFRSREVFILAIAAIALGTAYVSSLFGISLALGAFVGGVIVGESDLSHQILAEIMPLRDILAALFFVSVGMLVDPWFVVENPVLVLITAGLIVVAKGLLVTLITIPFGYSTRTVVLTGALLAQSAEFSFLLASLGADLGAVSPPVFSAMLAGSVASILLAPLLYRAALPLARRLEARQVAKGLAQLPLAVPPPPDGRRHFAVICGYGRVGQLIGEALRRRGVHFVVIEQDQRIARRLQDSGIDVLLGNADNSVLLEQAGIFEARVLVIAVPDALVTRLVVEYARRANPRLDIVARTHDPEEMHFLRGRGVDSAVLGEVELALEMTRHALRRFGVSATETQAIVQRLRERAGGEE